MKALGLLVVVLAAGCAREPDLHVVVDGSVLLWAERGGTVRRAHWVDGRLAGEVQEGAFTADERQWLVATTAGPGADQGRVIVFDANGRRVVSYAMPQTAPYGGESADLRWPVPGELHAFAWRGRRFVVASARGEFGASAVVLLEATARDRLEERLVHWQRQHIHPVRRAGDRLVVHGLLGKEGTHRTAVLWYDLARVLREAAGRGGCVRTSGPSAAAPGRSEAGPWEGCVLLPAGVGGPVLVTDPVVTAGRWAGATAEYRVTIDLDRGQTRIAPGPGLAGRVRRPDRHCADLEDAVAGP